MSLPLQLPAAGRAPALNVMLCADDYALSPAVSQGILEALYAGRLTATSVMANRPSWPEAAALLKNFDGRADIGLHLNLTLGAPLSAMASFASHGRFPQLDMLMRKARRGTLPEAEIRAEISRQLDAFEEEFHRPPDFVDGHQHVHVLSGIREWLLEELVHRDLAGRVWLRDSSDRIGRILARGVERPKALALAFFGHGFAKEARAAGFDVNDGFAGFSSFDPHRDFGADFERYLTSPGRRHLIMCHPGHVDLELSASDPVTITREAELDFLMSPRFIEILSRADAMLTRWPGEKAPEA